MSDVIGVDPVDLEALVDKTVAQFRTQYDALTDEGKLVFKSNCRAQIQNTLAMADQVRRETIDHVLRVFDVAAQSNSIKFIRDAIERFKREA